MATQLLERRPSMARTPADQSPLETTVDRGTRTLKSVLARIGQKNLKTLQVATNEVEFLVKTAQLAAKSIAQVDRTEQKLNNARLRGLKRIVELRKAAEPVLETGEACQLLGVSRETIRKKVDRRQIIALPKGGDRVFPTFQFKDGALIKGIPEVLDALDTDSVFTVLAFLLSHNPDFGNRTAVQLLEAGELEPVLREARVFLRHGG